MPVISPVFGSITNPSGNGEVLSLANTTEKVSGASPPVAVTGVYLVGNFFSTDTLSIKVTVEVAIIVFNSAGFASRLKDILSCCSPVESETTTV